MVDLSTSSPLETKHISGDGGRVGFFRNSNGGIALMVFMYL